jgi:hypothetical protein
VLAEHPRGGRFDAFWLIGGRVVDWGPLGDLDDVMARTVRALRGGDGTGATALLAPDEVDEARIVATWLDAHDAPALDLHGGADRASVARFLLHARAPAARPSERQLDDARRGLARGELGADVGLATHDGERDRPVAR